MYSSSGRARLHHQYSKAAAPSLLVYFSGIAQCNNCDFYRKNKEWEQRFPVCHLSVSFCRGLGNDSVHRLHSVTPL